MYTINFDKPLHIHFIGIGGISMSGLAEILLEEGFSVSGSDADGSRLTRRLASMGARISYGQRAENITDDIDVIVYTAAIHPDNPEFRRAAEKELPMLTRAQLLGQIMQNYGTPIAVAGTHGKTTTTSMAAQILLTAGCDPTVSVGGILPSIGGKYPCRPFTDLHYRGMRIYQQLSQLLSEISLILNMDADHLDFFKDIDDIRHSFRRFAELLPEDGTLIINADTPEYETVTAGLSCRVITYGLECSADYTAKDITYDEFGHPSLPPFSAEIPQVIFLCACLVSTTFPTPWQLSRWQPYWASGPKPYRRLSSFSGTDRRFQYKGNAGGVTIIDDYAHHPTEIRATLTAAGNYPHKNPLVRLPAAHLHQDKSTAG